MNIFIQTIKLLVSVGISPRLFKEIIAAHSVGRGQNAYNLKQYKQAFNILKPISDYDINDPYVGSAQMYVGLMYYRGLGVAQDKEKAKEYLKRSITNNNDHAMGFYNENY